MVYHRVFINDLERKIRNSVVRFFADDTRISKRITVEHDSVELQEDLDVVLKWSMENNMVLQKQKFELLIHRANENVFLQELPYASDMWSYHASEMLQISPVIELRDLGVMVTDDLSWGNHINTIVTRAKSISAWVLSVFQTRDRIVLITLYKSLVRSHLEYC